MADISAFPTIAQVLVEGNNLHRFIAGEALTAGQVVGFAATGVSKTVVAMDATSGEEPVGIVIFDAASGEVCTVACRGCWVKVAAADDTTGIDAGGLVEWNDNAVKGCVSEFTPRADLGSTVIDGSNDTTIDGSTWLIGQAMEDIAGGSYGIIEVNPQLMLYTDHGVVV